MLVFERVYTDGLAQLSYLVGDSKAAVAAVIDPRRDIDVYLRMARERGLRIAYVIETHYQRNGMSDWQNAALPLARIGQWTVHELDARREETDVQVLDVRSPGEVANGRVPGAKHIFVAHLAEQLDGVDRDKTTVIYCGSGYRASIAASILKREGFQKVVNTPGSWMAWNAAGLPVQKD